MKRGRMMINLSPIFSNHMVLQRNQNNEIWGKSSSETVTVLLDTYKNTVATDVEGNWSITLPKMKAGGPYRILIQGDEQIEIEDVMIGDVFLLGGQSNMEIPIYRTMDCTTQEDLVGEEDSPMIRKFQVPLHYEFEAPMEELEEGAWERLDRENWMNFSAIGYFLARELYQQHHVAIGLIHTAAGGTLVESWMKESTLGRLGEYEKRLVELRQEGYIEGVIESDQERVSNWHERLDQTDVGVQEKWYENGIPESKETMCVPGLWEGTPMESFRGSVWLQKRVMIENIDSEDILLYLGAMIDSDEVYINGKLVGRTEYRYPPRKYRVKPGVLRVGENQIAIRIKCETFAGGFVPEKPYHLRVGRRIYALDGAWKCKIGAHMDQLGMQTFFQYEPTALYNGVLYPIRRVKVAGIAFYQGESNTEYPEPYEQLFQAMIGDWRELFGEEVPFIFIGLSSFGLTKEEKEGTNWAVLREAQKKALCLPNTAMITTIDVGEWNDLHPQNKKEVGRRVALAMQQCVYGKRVEISGPTVLRADREKEEVILTFEHTGMGLVVKKGPLQGFSYKLPDGTRKEAVAYLKEDNVHVVLGEDRPTYLYYAWSNVALDANLYNKEGLPAVPFKKAIHNQGR